MQKESTEDQKHQAEFLKEHIRYELLMLRFTFREVMAAQSQFAWNALYEAFVVHARNLYYFLTNKQDPQSYKAKDYYQFKAKKTDATKGIFQDLHTQVLHLGIWRPSAHADKVQRDQIKAANDWVETNFRAFIEKLGEPYRSKWNWDAVDLVKCGAPPVGPVGPAREYLIVGPTGPTGPSAPSDQMYVTGPTSPGASSQPTITSSGYEKSK